jgi:citrate synthase
MTTATDHTPDTRPYSPGLEGVVGAESSIALVDGANGRLLYRGYPITQLVKHGTYAEVADLLWTGVWHAGATLPPEPVPAPVLIALRELPPTAAPMDALRTAVSVWGAIQQLTWPPTPEQARALTAFSPSALAAYGRIRQGLQPVEPDRSLGLAAAFLQQLNDETPDPIAAARSTRTSSSAPSTA